MGEIQLRPANKIDATILRYADSQSCKETSDTLRGLLSPAAVGARLQTLLATKDFLTAAQEDQLLTLKLKRILNELEDQHLDNDNANTRLKYLNAIGDRLDRRQKATEADLGVLYQNQGKIMGDVVDNALSYMKGALRSKVDPELWEELVREAMLHAQAEIAKHEMIEQ